MIEENGYHIFISQKRAGHTRKIKNMQNFQKSCSANITKHKGTGLSLSVLFLKASQTVSNSGIFCGILFSDKYAR